MRGARIIFPVALVCVLAAPRLNAQAASVDPCTLLTAAEVSSAVGIKSLPGRPYLGSKVVCLFAADTGSDIDSPAVNLMVQTSSAYEIGKNMGGALAPHAITGLGDEAYWVGSGSYAKLEVRKGSRAFSVSIPVGKQQKTLAQIEQMEEALARKAVARL